MFRPTGMSELLDDANYGIDSSSFLPLVRN